MNGKSDIYNEDKLKNIITHNYFQRRDEYFKMNALVLIKKYSTCLLPIYYMKYVHSVLKCTAE